MSTDPVLPRREPDSPALPAVPRAIVVDDESDTLDAASLALRDAGFEVTVAASAAVALRGLQDSEFDLVVLDVMLPDSSGIDLLREIRAGGDVPVIMLGAGDSEAERVLGLELGADDYVTKPFSPLELASRGRAILRRGRREQLAARSVRAVGLLRIDLPRHEVMLGERSVDVTASEFRVLALLAGSPGTVFTRRQIMEHLWGGPYFGDGHPVDTHVLNLRRKVEADPTRPRRLLTVRGVGFKLVVPACEAR
jgi:two-component system, OmpR family, response regulator RegX3